MGPRIAARAAVALVAVLFAAMTLGLATPSRSEPVGAATAAPCTPSDRCATHGVTVTPQGHAAEPCLRSASCGGGALLAGGGIVMLAVLGAAIALVAPSPGRRMAAAHDGASTGRLAAGRLYRPPRLSL